MRHQLTIAAALLVGFASASGAQEPGFDPFPGGAAAVYRFDLARNFFTSEDAAAADRHRLRERATRLLAESGRPPSPLRLLQLLRGWDSLSRGVGRQYAYLSLRGAIDTRDTAAQQDLFGLADAVEPVVEALERVLAGVPEREMLRYIEAEPHLARYAYAAQLLRREQAHRLDSAAEGVLSALEGPATSWGPSLFQTTLGNTDFGTVRAGDRVLSVRQHGNEIRNHSDRAVRKQGYELGQAGIRARRDTYAFILSRQADMRNRIARQRRWPDYVTQAYALGELDRAGVEGMTEAMRGAAEINLRYEQRRRADLQREQGLDTVFIWDLTAPPRGGAAPRFTIAEATRRIVAAAAPLGSAYVAELSALLDPANGRLDLIARPNRVDRPGFSTGSVGYPSMFFQGRFEGFTEDVVILAHEAGHAVQNMLMDSAGVLPRYSRGPNYFTESFATFAELLLLDHLARTDPSEEIRRFFRRQLVENGLDVFRSAYETQLELQLYDSAAAGRMLNADAIEALSQAIGSRYSIWLPVREYAWVQPIQFFTRPQYRVNYLVAKLLALTYFDRMRQDPVRFAERYAALLRNGYDAPPQELLKRFLDVDMAKPADLVAAGTRVLGNWANERP